jgi:hypothetical protein
MMRSAVRLVQAGVMAIPLIFSACEPDDGRSLKPGATGKSRGEGGSGSGGASGSGGSTGAGGTTSGGGTGGSAMGSGGMSASGGSTGAGGTTSGGGTGGSAMGSGGTSASGGSAGRDAASMGSGGSSASTRDAAVDASAPRDTGPPPTFAQLYNDYFNKVASSTVIGCRGAGNACHDVNHEGFICSTKANCYSSIMVRVDDPMDPDSCIITVILKNKQMPKGGTNKKFATADLERLKAWIVNGAKND